MNLSLQIGTHDLIQEADFYICTKCGINYNTFYKQWHYKSIFVIEQKFTDKIYKSITCDQFLITCDQFLECKAKKLDVLNKLGHKAEYKEKYSKSHNTYCEQCNTMFFLTYENYKDSDIRWYYGDKDQPAGWATVINCDLMIMRKALE